MAHDQLRAGVNFMIIVNNGMVKSGSSLLMHYTLELIRKVFPRNGYEAFWDAVVAGELPGVGGYMDAPTAETLPVLERIHLEYGPLPIKTHTDINDFLKAAILDSRFIMLTTYRDPRDMILSAIDHCKRSKGTKLPAFQEFTTIRESIPHARMWCRMALNWIDSGLTLSISYEDLLLDPHSVIRRVAEFAKIPVCDDLIACLIQEEKDTRLYAKKQFNKGLLTRFRDEMTSDEIAYCDEHLGEEIQRLGYKKVA